MPKDNKIILKIVLDFVLLLTVGIPVLIFHLYGKPTLRGFNCDDDSIRYPFHESTITNNVLYVVGVFLPVGLICLTEFTNEAHSKRGVRGRTKNLLGKPIPRVVWKIYIRVGVFLFGACVSQLTTDIAKYSIGRLRPHFLQVCNPFPNCTSISDPHAYITNFTCLSTDQHRLRESRLSFPSGHSSFSAYTMVFAVIYLQKNMLCNVNKLLKPFLQFILLMMTWYTALSRIADYKHHWSDVLAGFLQGSLVAIITAYFVSDFFIENKEKSEVITLQNMSTDAQANYNTMETTTDIEDQSSETPLVLKENMMYKEQSFSKV
ncbi:putative phosphatidate phosphatase [Uloborus diversus]|uniref:putative phosphatidate phosphatase n=1 Tax=Uloborus diversus TaxID=327109 RepID=UPI00240A21E7|nr:putative phosphatidate phosphatase [Uloborus diversus]